MYYRYYLLKNIIYNKTKYVLYFILLMIMFYIEAVDANTYITVNNSNAKVGVFYLIINLFLGMQKYTPGIGIKFEVPYMWIINIFYISFFMGDIPSTNSDFFEIKAFKSNHKRSSYALAVFLSILMNIVIASVVFALVVVIYFCFIGWNRFESILFLNARHEIDFTFLEKDVFLIEITIIFLLGVLMIMMLQSVVCYFWDAKVSYIFVLLLLVIGTYYVSFLLPGNYCMILRNGEICYRGVTLIQCLIYSIVCVFIFFFSISINIAKKDLL